MKTYDKIKEEMEKIMKSLIFKPTFEIFCNMVRSTILSYLPEEYSSAEVVIMPMVKPQCRYTGIMVMKPNENACLTFSLEYFYENFRSVDAACRAMAKRIKNEKTIPYEEIMKTILDYETASEYLQIHICDINREGAVLRDVPYTELVGGYAVIYYVAISTYGDSQMATIIKNNLLSTWGISKERLHRDALANNQAKYPAKLFPMDDMPQDIDDIEKIAAYMAEKDADVSSALEFEDSKIMTLHTNQVRGGAAVIAYPGVLEKISKQFGSFYILPSSVNELIIIPDTDDFDADVFMLSEWVREINEKAVAPHEQLSDTVLYFDAADGELKKAEDKTA